MSQSGLTAEHGVAWPSNGISEVPFRVYTDQAQYDREQERQTLFRVLAVLAVVAVVLFVLTMTTGVQDVMVNPLPSKA